MSQVAFSRRKAVFIAAFALAVIGVAAFGLSRLGGDDGTPTASAPGSRESSAPPSSSAPTPEPSETDQPVCEGPDTLFNVEGIRQDSLLPDCGAPVVTLKEQRESGLGLGCGGSYPVILYKTTTSDAKTSICGKDASGVEFHLVTRARGGEVLDLPGDYDPQLDAFVATKGNTTYAVIAYDGSLVVTTDGTSSTQPSDGSWISLDNESDYD